MLQHGWILRHYAQWNKQSQTNTTWSYLSETQRVVKFIQQKVEWDCGGQEKELFNGDRFARWKSSENLFHNDLNILNTQYSASTELHT